VTVGSYVSPGDYASGLPGSISANIDVRPALNSTPEPSSLILACLGLPSLGLVRWFRQRRRKVVDDNASKA
jgi:hypothetical protein